MDIELAQVDGLGDELGYLLQVVAVCLIKLVELVAIDVEHAYHLALNDKGNHNLRTRERTASNMTRELFYVGYDLCTTFSPSCTTYATPAADAEAGGTSLERTEYQVVGILDQVEAYPEVVKGLV